jgi:arylsulfatase
VQPTDRRRGLLDHAVLLPANGTVTATPYAGDTQIPLGPEPIFARKKGGAAEVVATYDAEFRAGFDRKITDWAIDFMTRARDDGKPIYVYLPYPQVHIPPIPDPEFAGTTKRDNFADTPGRTN